MGGGPESKPEHMLVTLPFPEPTPIIERIRKHHPQITVTYRDLNVETPFESKHDIPDGISS